MLIVLTGLQPTLWFADVRGADRDAPYRKFLFARVVHDGKPLICAMCIVTGGDGVQSRRGPYVPSFYVRELGLGLTPVRYHEAVIGTMFENVRTAQTYAINRALEILKRVQTRELLLHVSEMYDAMHYKNWEKVCL